uniref:Putative sulfotransferase n=1 Tax=Amblyomma aureolatum TaxID=187763 RepID=A0A1E1X8F2_9ACAR
MATTEEDPNQRPFYVDFDGYRLSSAFDADLLRSALEYKPRADDVFVVTFPKCGTTWVQHIAYLIYNDGHKPKDGLDFLKNSPFLEMTGADCLPSMKRPGIIKSHFPYSMMPMSPEAKYIYVCRNPKDCVTSFFYHTKGFPGYKFTRGTFSTFFDIFCEGQTDFGDYFDHVLGWHEHRDEPNILFLHYEDMKAEPRESVLKIAKFLGQHYHDRLLQDASYLENVLRYSDVSAMKQYTNDSLVQFFSKPLQAGELVPEGLQLFHKVTHDNPSEAKLVRKGIVGDWKSHLTPEMNDRLDSKIHERLAGTEFLDVWKRHGVM